MATKNKGAGARKYDRNRKSGQNLSYIAQARHDKSHRRRIGGGKFKPAVAA